MQNQNIDHGNKFDWGKTSADYARFRDIYPSQFYEMILNRGCGTAGQRVLDVGTGTGVLPRNLYAAGAHWTGCDIAPNQIAQAKQLSQGMEIAYLVSTAETLPTLPPEEIAAWEAEHLQLLEQLAPESFTIRHYAALAELTKKS